MWSQDHGGLTLELGPQRARLTAGFRALVEALDLEKELLTAPVGLPLYVYSRGRLRTAPLSLRTAITTSLLPWTSKLRILAEPFLSGPLPDETAGAFLQRKFGRTAYRRLLGPLYGGLYGSDPERMPVRHALAPTLRVFGVGRSMLWRMILSGGKAEEAAPCSFTSGLGELPRALSERLGDRVCLGAPVRSVRRAEGSWEVAVGDESVTRVDQIVLTCPADAAAEILRDACPAEATALAGLTYNPLAVVHMRSEGGMRGLGYQIGLDEDFVTRGVTWNDSLFGRSGLYTAFLGGMKAPELVGRPDSEIGSLACREFEAVTGRPAEVIMVSRTRMPAWDHSWDALADLDLPAGLHLCSNYSARPGIQGRLHHTGILARRLAGGGPSS